ncbi:MASE1 domain-containing protein [Aliikangiella sp. IMCC44653]
MYQFMPQTKQLFEILLTAIIYVVAARIGQLFSIEPGNVTPVWIPSGLMIALVLYKGYYLWPGVFLGAFIGNIWAYLKFDSFYSILAAVLAASLNGIGDVICCVVMAYLIQKKIGSHYPFLTIYDFLVYLILAVILGPLISAVFGVSGLTLFNFIDLSNFATTFITWFIGDATGAMIFGPLLLAWLVRSPYRVAYQVPIVILLSIYCVSFTAMIFGLVSLPKWLLILMVLLIPVALFTVMYSGQRAVFTIQTMVASLAVYATSLGHGPFAEASGLKALLDLQLFIALFSLVMFSIAIIVYRQKLTSLQLKNKQVELENLFRLDQLTNIWNRYRITEFVEVELSRFSRSGRPFGIIMLDIDNFKRINDEYGHTEGDKVLVSLSQLIKVHVRHADLFGRWGGEEFIIVCTDTDKKSLIILAEKVRTIISENKLGLEKSITISLGATLVQPNDSIISLVDRADEALYQSKANGKNQVSFK